MCRSSKAIPANLGSLLAVKLLNFFEQELLHAKSLGPDCASLTHTGTDSDSLTDVKVTVFTFLYDRKCKN